MSLAEQIRNEINVTKELPWLEESVVRHVKGSGRYCIICDTHIERVNKDFSVPYKYFEPICDWARKEGFRAGTVYNSYGVKHIEITL